MQFCELAYRGSLTHKAESSSSCGITPLFKAKVNGHTLEQRLGCNLCASPPTKPNPASHQLPVLFWTKASEGIHSSQSCHWRVLRMRKVWSILYLSKLTRAATWTMTFGKTRLEPGNLLLVKEENGKGLIKNSSGRVRKNI